MQLCKPLWTTPSSPHSSQHAHKVAYTDRDTIITYCFFVCRSTVRLVLSNRAGMGKSLFITRMAEKLAKRLFQFTPQQNRQAADKLVTIPIHGPDISNDDVIDILSKLSFCQGPKILHLDVASQVSLSDAAITTILHRILLHT